MITATGLVKRALQICDIVNTDFLTYEELTSYCNEAFKWVMQSIVNHNIDIFTTKAHLVGSNGKYKLPFDFWQMKVVKNPYSGQIIIRKTDSFPKCSSGYNIANGYIELDGLNPGPIEIVYYQKPFYISLPNKTIEDQNLLGIAIIDTSENNILFSDNQNNLSIWTPTGIIPVNFEKEDNFEYKLIRDEYIVKLETIQDQDDTDSDGNVLPPTYELTVVDLNNNVIFSSSKKPDYFIKSDNGLVYFGYINENNVDIYKLGNLVKTMPNISSQNNTFVCIENDFYEVPENSFPIGMFDDRPAYTLNDSLNLITDNPSYTITEKLDLPIMKIDNSIKYGIISNGKIYSNIPDTSFNFPNNILYDLIAFRLAVYFLCKQNAEATGVESMYKAMEKQFFESIDASAGYPRLLAVRG